MSDELVTIAEFNTAFDAEAAKDCLEENDIKAAVVGEDLVSLMIPIPEVTVELKVFEVDAERAKAVLEIHQAQCEASSNGIDEEAEEAGDGGEDA